MKTRPAENEENVSSREGSDLQIWLWIFLVDNSSKEATELARKASKFQWGQNLEAFMVEDSCVTTSSPQQFSYFYVVTVTFCLTYF
jgi:hypothetical protein